MKVACLLVLAGCGCAGAAPRTGPQDVRPDAQVVGATSPDAAVHPEKVVQINHGGELVDIEASFVPGYVTIVDFWADWCGACVTMEEAFMPVIADEPRILVRKVDVGDGDTPVADHYDIGPLPHLRVYDTHGELQYILMNAAALETGQKALEVLRQDQAKE